MEQTNKVNNFKTWKKINVCVNKKHNFLYSYIYVRFPHGWRMIVKQNLKCFLYKFYFTIKRLTCQNRTFVLRWTEFEGSTVLSFKSFKKHTIQ